MLRREVGAYSRLPLTALHLPLYFSRPALSIPRYRSTLGIPPVYPAKGLLRSSADDRVPLSRRKQNLKVVKKPFKPSQKQTGARNFFPLGTVRRNSVKPSFRENKNVQKVKNEAQRPRLMVARVLDLADEVRALHALWRAGPSLTDAKIVQKGKNESQSQGLVVDGSVDLVEEVRALHNLWRAGPAGTHSNVAVAPKRKPVPLLAPIYTVVGSRKVDSRLDLGTPNKRAHTESGSESRKSRKQKKRKLARRAMSTDQSKHVQMPSTPSAMKPVSTCNANRLGFSTELGSESRKSSKQKKGKLARRATLTDQSKHVQVPSTPAMKPVSSCNVSPLGFSTEKSAITNLIRRPNFSLMTNDEEVQLEMPLQKDACKHMMVYSSTDDGGIELKKLTPDEVKEKLEMPIELQNDACKHVMQFLSAVDGGVELEKLTPDEEKEREEEGFLFFSDLFKKNSMLRSLYVGQGNGGTLDCLVCHSIGESKSFDKVLSLVMHATSRVKRRPEHRGYGRALSTILGWNSNRSSL